MFGTRIYSAECSEMKLSRDMDNPTTSFHSVEVGGKGTVTIFPISSRANSPFWIFPLISHLENPASPRPPVPRPGEVRPVEIYLIEVRAYSQIFHLPLVASLDPLLENVEMFPVRQRLNLRIGGWKEIFAWTEEIEKGKGQSG
jgi:hypothetical protein